METNWEQVSRKEQKIIQKNIVQKEQWIIDGNYEGTLDIRLEAADTIIFMDIHHIVCVYRALKRYFQYKNKSRPDMVVGNEERTDFNFYKWIWNYPKEKRPGILKDLKEIAHEKNIIILKSPKEVKFSL